MVNTMLYALTFWISLFFKLLLGWTAFFTWQTPNIE